MDGRKAEQIARDIAQAGGRAYYVGGSVRDKLLGREATDWDIEVYGLQQDRLSDLLSSYGAVSEVGKSFGVLKLHGTEYDFTLPRTETKTGEKHTDFAVEVDPFLAPEQATRRRDFTVNALLEDILTGEIIDHHGGRQDLADKVIRHIDDRTFKEDALRVYRAARFAAVLGFTIADETLDLCRAMDVTLLSEERVFNEMTRLLLEAKRPSVGLEYLRQMGVLKARHPRLQAMVHCLQDATYHPEGDVWTHTLYVVDNAAALKYRSGNPMALMWAALLHDVGKPTTTTMAQGRISSPAHGRRGYLLAMEMMDKFKASNKLNDDTSQLVREHMTPAKMYRERRRVTATELRTLANRSHLRELLLLAEADWLGRGSVDSFEEIQAWFDAKIARLNLPLDKGLEQLVRGRDLLALGMEEGPTLGSWLDQAFQWQLEGLTYEEIMEKIKEEWTQ